MEVVKSLNTKEDIISIKIEPVKGIDLEKYMAIKLNMLKDFIESYCMKKKLGYRFYEYNIIKAFIYNESGEIDVILIIPGETKIYLCYYPFDYDRVEITKETEELINNVLRFINR